jgi:hypothetical protein
MKITLAGDLQEKFKQGYQIAGENDEGELEWFEPTKKTAGEKLAELLNKKNDGN